MTVHLSTLSSDGNAGTPTGNGARYVLMSTWESAAQGFHQVGDQTILECYKGTTTEGQWQADGSLLETVGVDGWSNVTATDYIHIKAAAGQEHNGVIGAGFVLQATGSFNTALNISELHVDLSDIELRGQNSDNAKGLVSGNQGSPWPEFNRCIFKGGNNTNANGAAVNGGVFINCLAYNCYTGFSANSGFRSYYAYNCTAVDCVNLGFSVSSSPSAPFLFENNVAYDCAGGAWNTDGGSIEAASSNNAADDTSVTTIGIGTITDVAAADFVDYQIGGAGDYSAAPGGKLDGAGEDLSGDFTDDITGQTRTQWDIGAYGIISAGDFADTNAFTITISTGGSTGSGDGTFDGAFSGLGAGTYVPLQFSGSGDGTFNGLFFGNGFGSVAIQPISGSGDGAFDATFTGFGLGTYSWFTDGSGDGTFNGQFFGNGFGTNVSLQDISGSGDGAFGGPFTGYGLGTVSGVGQPAYGIYLGGVEILSMSLGSTPIARAFHGTKQIFGPLPESSGEGWFNGPFTGTGFGTVDAAYFGSGAGDFDGTMTGIGSATNAGLSPDQVYNDYVVNTLGADHHWPMNDGNGATEVVDIAGNGNLSIVSGTPKMDATPIFGFTEDSIRTESNPARISRDGAFVEDDVFSIVINARTINPGTVSYLWTNSDWNQTNSGWRLWLSGVRLYFEIYSLGTWYSCVRFDLDWNNSENKQIVITRELVGVNYETKMYWDGSLIQTVNTPGISYRISGSKPVFTAMGISDSTDNTYDSRVFDGKVQQASYFKRTLTAVEVANLWTNTPQ